MLMPPLKFVKLPEFYGGSLGYRGGVSYLLLDKFLDTLAAGFVNNTGATPGPGTRTVVDTLSKLSVATRVLTLAATANAAGDPGLWYASQARGFGRTYLGRVILPATAARVEFGFDASAAGSILDSLRFGATTVLSAVENGVAVVVGAYAAATYDVALVMRATGYYYFIKGGAFANWTLLWVSAVVSAAGLPGLVAETSAMLAFTADNLRVPDALFVVLALIYDSFIRANGALGSTGIVGPDGQVVESQAWGGGAGWAIAGNLAANTPTLGSELLTDPGLETWTNSTTLTNYTKSLAGTSTLNQETTTIHGGANAARLDIDASNSSALFYQATALASNDFGLVSVWARADSGTPTASISNSGSGSLGVALTLSTSYQQFFRTIRDTSTSRGLKRLSAASRLLYFDDFSVKKVNLASCIADVQASNQNILARVPLTLATGCGAGIILCLDSDLDGYVQNYRLVWYDTANIYIDEMVAGTVTVKQTTAITYVAAAILAVVNDGVNLTAYYNGIKVGSTQTMIASPYTLCGLFSAYAGNTLGAFLILPLGANGEYNDLEAK